MNIWIVFWKKIIAIFASGYPCWYNTTMPIMPCCSRTFNTHKQLYHFMFWCRVRTVRQIHLRSSFEIHLLGVILSMREQLWYLWSILLSAYHLSVRTSWCPTQLNEFTHNNSKTQFGTKRALSAIVFCTPLWWLFNPNSHTYARSRECPVNKNWITCKLFKRDKMCITSHCVVALPQPAWSARSWRNRKLLISSDVN